MGFVLHTHPTASFFHRDCVMFLFLLLDVGLPVRPIPSIAGSVSACPLGGVEQSMI